MPPTARDLLGLGLRVTWKRRAFREQHRRCRAREGHGGSYLFVSCEFQLPSSSAPSSLPLKNRKAADIVLLSLSFFLRGSLGFFYLVSILERQAVAAAAHINRCLLRVQWSSGPFVLDVWSTAFPLGEAATGEATLHRW